MNSFQCLQALKEEVYNDHPFPTERIALSAVLSSNIQDVMIEVKFEPRHTRQGKTDCACQRRFAEDTKQLGVQPYLEIVEDRLCVCLPDLDTSVWWDCAT